MRDLVDRKLALLAGYLDHLEDLATLSLDELTADYRATGAARYYLQVAIECCLDIGAHVIASDTSRRAETYRAICELLGQESIVPTTIADAMIPAAALRNRLVHGYDQVDDRRVHEMLPIAASTLRAFAQAMAVYLERPSR